jgi:hypothetical protein
MIELRINEGAFRCQKADHQRIEEISISDFYMCCRCCDPGIYKVKKETVLWPSYGKRRAMGNFQLFNHTLLNRGFDAGKI